MLINTTPPRTIVNATPAGPCVSTDRIRAGCYVLSLPCMVDALGIDIAGRRFASLSEADAWIDAEAESRGGLWPAVLQDAQSDVERRADQARREARFNLYAKENQLSPGQQARMRQRRALRVLGVE